MSSFGPEPLLAMRIGQRREARIDQRVAIYPGGKAWHWSLSSVNPESAFRVGTFAVQLDASALQEVEAASQRLQHVDSEWANGDAHAPQVTISAGSHGVSFPEGADIDPRLFEVYSLTARIMAEASAAPFSALELTVRPQPGWPRPGQAGRFAFLFQALGTEPVRFTLDRNSFSLQGDDWSFQPPELRGVGLIAAGGRQVDGIYAEAQLKPGETAALVLRDLPPFTQPGPVRVAARVEGTIVLVGPEVGPSADGERFLLSRLVEGVIGPA